MEQDNRDSRNSTPNKKETGGTGSTERLFARLSIGSHSRGGRHSRSPSNCSAYSEGESRFEKEDEEEPDEPFFDERFQLALKGGVGLAGEVANTLYGCGLVKDTSSNLHQLWEEAMALHEYKNPVNRTVGIVGDSGEGKSSLINSLLDHSQLARTSDGGSACTSIITEYRHKPNRFTEPYTIEVEYMNNVEICGHLKELLWSFRQLYIGGIEEAASDTDYKTYQTESELAWHTLEAAFGHRKELTREYLQDSSEGAENRIYDQLRKWACEIDWPGDGQGMWLSTAATTKECSRKMLTFNKDSLWPFTRVIRVYLDAKVLDTGVVLADLPGFHDTNLARVKAAQEYIRNCDEIFIVARINRVITNYNLQNFLKCHLGNGWENHAKKACNIAIVCTFSENIDVDTAKTDVGTANVDVSTAKNEYWCSIDPTEIQALNEEIQDAEDEDDTPRHKRAKLKQKYTFISARNAHVTRELKKAYAKLISTSDLRVFCIGNSDYKKFVSPKKRAEISLINATGVPDLRRFCRSITAKPQFEAGLQFLEIQIPTLLHSIELWIGTGAGKDTATKPKDVADESAFLHQVDALIDDAERSAKARLLTVIGGTTKLRYVDWNWAALDAASDWNDWHWTQYNAWCRHYGTHTTAKRGSRCWNMEITEAATREIKPQWQRLEHEFRSLFEKLGSNINQEIRKLASNIADVGRSSSSSTTFLDSIKLRRQRVGYLLDKDLTKFLRGFNAIQRSSIENHVGSYIFDEMLDTYRWCAMQGGTGMLARQRGKMHDRLSRGDLFLNINGRIEKDFDNLLVETFDRIQKDICAVLHELGRDIAELGRTKKGESDRFPEFKKEVKAMLGRAKDELAGVQRDVNATKARFQERT